MVDKHTVSQSVSQLHAHTHAHTHTNTHKHHFSSFHTQHKLVLWLTAATATVYHLPSPSPSHPSSQHYCLYCSFEYSSSSFSSFNRCCSSLGDYSNRLHNVTTQNTLFSPCLQGAFLPHLSLKTGFSCQVTNYSVNWSFLALVVCCGATSVLQAQTFSHHTVDNLQHPSNVVSTPVW